MKSEKMRLCSEGAELFLSYLNQEKSLEEVIDHVSYRTVFAHAKFYGNELSIKDVVEALEGKQTPFFGLNRIEDKLDQIRMLINIIKENESNWIKIIYDIYTPFVEEVELDEISIYPIIGYDVGIGFNGNVCMNLNYRGYINKPTEFLNMIIHEVFHVIYEKHHRLTCLDELKTPEQWFNAFKIALQNEGYAVYLPLNLRLKNDDIFDENYFTIKDYTIILNNEKMSQHITSFLELVELFKSNTKLSEAECDNYVFGPYRYSYRVGCELIRRIERVYGLAAVKEGIYLDAAEFFDKYIHLIEDNSIYFSKDL